MTELVQMTLRTTYSQVKVQGKLTEHFETNYGVRQGDPLAPTLFSITLEEKLKICPGLTEPVELIPSSYLTHHCKCLYCNLFPKNLLS